MLIGIGGKKQAGKDTVAMLIKTLLNEHFEIKKISGRIKDMACILLNCNREQLEDEKFKSMELGKEWDCLSYTLSPHDYRGPLYNSKKELYYDLGTNKIDNNEKVAKVKMTPRLLLQLLGTECGMHKLHPNIWNNLFFSDYDKLSKPKKSFFPNWIVSDCRFESSIDAIKQRNGFTINVISNRTTSNDTHKSETSLDNFKNWDYVIKNNGSKEDLFYSVKRVLDMEIKKIKQKLNKKTKC